MKDLGKKERSPYGKSTGAPQHLFHVNISFQTFMTSILKFHGNNLISLKGHVRVTVVREQTSHSSRGR